MGELEKYPARCLSCKLLYEANGLQGKTEMIANVCQQFNNNIVSRFYIVQFMTHFWVINKIFLSQINTTVITCSQVSA